MLNRFCFLIFFFIFCVRLTSREEMQSLEDSDHAIVHCFPPSHPLCPFVPSQTHKCLWFVFGHHLTHIHMFTRISEKAQKCRISVSLWAQEQNQIQLWSVLDDISSVYHLLDLTGVHCKLLHKHCKDTSGNQCLLEDGWIDGWIWKRLEKI